MRSDIDVHRTYRCYYCGVLYQGYDDGNHGAGRCVGN